jgi:hypothetical protein
MNVSAIRYVIIELIYQYGRQSILSIYFKLLSYLLLYYIQICKYVPLCLPIAINPATCTPQVRTSTKSTNTRTLTTNTNQPILSNHNTSNKYKIPSNLIPNVQII